MSYVTQGRHGLQYTLVDPCLLSGLHCQESFTETISIRISQLTWPKGRSGVSLVAYVTDPSGFLVFFVFLFCWCGVAPEWERIVIVYLFTCEVIPHGPGRASQGTSAPGCASLASWLDRAAPFPLGAAQLGSSQRFVGSPKIRAFFNPFYFTRYLVPTVNHT